jgi:Beta-lactamase
VVDTTVVVIMVQSKAWLSCLFASGIVRATTDGYASSDCPLLGPDMPVPTALSSNSYFQQATKSFPQALSNGTYGNINLSNVTFSVSVFSAIDKKTLYSLYNTAESVKSAPTGVKNVDGDSVYRLGSISKLLTIYAILMELGDGHWNDPITRYVPELKQAQSNYSASSAIDSVQWEEVTLGELASHMAGITRDGNEPSLLERLATNLYHSNA